MQRISPMKTTPLWLAVLLLLASSCATDPKPTEPCTGDDCIDVADVEPEEEESCTTNVCGGCETLTAAPGDACGTCGVQVCDDGGLRCEEGTPNACGGCDSLSNTIGESCGTCGTWQCDGEEALTCMEVINSCGGCNELEGVADESCGQCGNGIWTCKGSDIIECVGDEINGCGGCATLPGIPERPCGECGGGVWTCQGTEELECVGANDKNACGGCALLNGEVGDPCGTCLSGTLQCNTDGSWLVCANQAPCDPCSSTDNNDVIASATNLGNFDDGYESNDYESALHSAADVDFLKLHVYDATISNMNVRGHLVDDSLADLCIYFARDDQRAPNLTCLAGLPSTHEGRHGCCSVSPGGEVEIKDENAAPGRDDSGTVYYRISSTLVSGCHDYHLWFGL
jgi:hypothetical protein